MCDYSIHNAKTRPAVVGDKLETYQFGYTTSFAAQGETGEGCHDGRTAVCLRPGTEIAFTEPVAFRSPDNGQFIQSQHTVAIFRQIDMETIHRHHDCLEFENGTTVLLNQLCERQRATVLQLPAEAKPDSDLPAINSVTDDEYFLVTTNGELVKID